MHENPYRDLSKVQKAKILEILNLNASKDKEVQELAPDPNLRIKDNVWKVLIYDKLGQRIISPLLRVNELRDQGVTVNLSLDSERQSIPGVPAIYMIEPSRENVLKIVNDVQRLLYKDIQIHFLSPCPRPILELLAQSIIPFNLPELPISRIFDQNLNYICLDRRLFSLEMNNSYYTLKNPNTTEQEVEEYIDRITSSLHSIFATLGQIPYIRYQPSSAGEAIARKLYDSIGSAVLSRVPGGPFSSNISQFNAPENRPLLILIDRSIDVTTMISHQWTYASLVYDVFDVNVNRIAYTDPKTRKVTHYDIGPEDVFWEKNSSLPFSQVADNLNAGINECKIAYDDIKNNYNIDPNDDIDIKSLTPNTTALISAMKQIPIITEKKRILDMHMKIATRIMDSIRVRHLDSLFTAEESASKQIPSSILNTLNDPQIQPEDKLRLFIVYYLSNKDEADTDIQKFEASLKEAGCDTEPLKYLHEVRRLTQLSTLKGVPNSSTAQQPYTFLGKVSNIGSKISDHLRESGVSSHIENLVTNVRRLLPVSKNLPITRIIEVLSENKSNFVTDQEYHILNPRTVLSSQNTSVHSQKPVVPLEYFSNVVAFIIGGGNTIEYQNVMETVKDSSTRSLIYGSTEITSPQKFLKQLHALGLSKK